MAGSKKISTLEKKDELVKFIKDGLYPQKYDKTWEKEFLKEVFLIFFSYWRTISYEE